KVEYSFEQLKIDRLDGTLMIGLSPADTGTIEQLDAAGQLSEDVPLAGSSPQSPPHPYAPVYDPVNDYILHAVPGMLDECARGRQTVPLSEAQKEQVRNDLIRQADERIRLYMRHY